ncbi:MAG: molybdopterin-binding protein [Deltaproteobacteria bacterium]|nr:molybdopterin-binding protein [Deltaproteobacteria bacterium]
MKKISVYDAVGTVLAHDLTRIVPDQEKGAGFKKGHIILERDIPELLKIGKRHLYVLDLPSDRLHEDDAALRIAKAICGECLRWTAPQEGKSSIISSAAGLLKIDVDALLAANRMDDIIIATLKTNTPCKEGQIVGGTRIIPLTISAHQIETLERMALKAGPIMRVRPFRRLKVGGVVTGSEIKEGLIKDEFEKFVNSKLKAYGCQLLKKIIVSDDPDAIAAAIQELRNLGCELILTTGGLSVDPDDVTRQGVAQAGGEKIFYGSPVLPGAMFLYARLGEIPIMGLPACVYFYPTTVFDLLLPRLLADDPITPDDIAAMGHGGLCLQCKTCRFPICPFGK